MSATDVVMENITNLVEQLRGEKAPTHRWDPAEKGQTATGNYVKAQQKSSKETK